MCRPGTGRDDHSGVGNTYPDQSPHLESIHDIIIIYHIFIEVTGLVHNHPSGDPTPSRADIDMTHMIINSAKPLGITVHDHIIIGKDGYVSFKGLKLI